MISFTWATLSEHRGLSGKRRSCQAVPQKAKHRSREKAAQWCWQCCNTRSRGLWNGLGAYIGSKTSSLHRSPACAYILVIPALSLCIHCCAIRGVSSRTTYDRLPQSRVWEVGDVRRGLRAPQLPRHLSQKPPGPTASRTRSVPTETAGVSAGGPRY